jgi:hypothetical protein
MKAMKAMKAFAIIAAVAMMASCASYKAERMTYRAIARMSIESIEKNPEYDEQTKAAARATFNAWADRLKEPRP